MSETMHDLPEGEPEKVDNTAPEARETLAALDETVAFLAAEMLMGGNDV